jgi:hypothetical protein
MISLTNCRIQIPKDALLAGESLKSLEVLIPTEVWAKWYDTTFTCWPQTPPPLYLVQKILQKFKSETEAFTDA